MKQVRDKARRHRGTHSLAALVTVIALASACASSNPASDEGVQPAAEESRAQLTVGWGADIHGLDKSAVIGEQTIRVQQQIYATLFDPAPDGRGVVPNLAESHELSEDGRRWTITLKEGLKFSDGTPLESDDVVFSLTESRDQGGLLSFLYREFAHIEAVDERTLEIATTEPFAPMLAVLSERSAAVVPAGYGGRERDAFYEAPVSSGPFQLEQWDRGERIVLVRNPHYHGNVALERVTFEVVPDDNARVLKLRDGQLDVLWNVPFANVDELASAEGLRVVEAPWTLVDVVVLNQASGPLADVHARRAVSLAIDREAIVSAILRGYGEPAASFVSQSLVDEQMVGYSRYDLDSARSELAASSHPEGFSFTLKYPGNDQTAAGVVQVLQEQLAKLGVTVELVPSDPAVLSGSWVSGDFEAAYLGLSSGIPDADFMSTAFVASQGFFTGYATEEAAPLAASAAAALAEDHRQATYTAFLEKVMEDVPVIALHAPANLFVIDAGLRGFEVSLPGEFFLEHVG